MATLSEHTSRRVFVGLLAFSLVMLALVFWPFATALFVAAVLAGMLAPLHKRLTRRLRGRAKIAASLLVASVMVLILAPLGGLTAFVVKEASDGYGYVTKTVRSEGMSGLLAKLPDRIEEPVRKALATKDSEGQPQQENLQEKVTEQGATAAKAATGFAAATGRFVLHAVLMLIALFFFLLEGGALIAWMERHAPLKPGQTYELLLEFRKVSAAVIISSVVTAAVQTAVAAVGYFIARVPYALFFTGVTFFVALIPAVGAAAVCLVAALLLLATGHTTAAIFLAIWGVVVVGLVDNVVKPILAKRGLDIHAAIVFFSLLGGLAAFGAVGILIGPMAVAFFLALIRIYERDYQRRLPPDEKDDPVEAPRTGLSSRAASLPDKPVVTPPRDPEPSPT